MTVAAQGHGQILHATGTVQVFFQVFQGGLKTEERQALLASRYPLVILLVM